MIRILLADDHEFIRSGMHTLLSAQVDMEVVGDVCSFQELIRLSQQTQSDIILSELYLKDGDLTPNISELLKYCPLLLILTACKDREKHLHALRLGAKGIVLKDQCVEMTIKAIRSVCAGEVWIDHTIKLDLWRNFILTAAIKSPVQNTAGKLSFDPSSLTPNEFEVARLAARGLSAKKIGEILFLSDKTVRNKLTTVYSKLGVSSQVELVIQSANLGLLTTVKEF